ncbi:MAG: methyltransferase domain-containing protein [Ilumatobacteraceae bacterium]
MTDDASFETYHKDHWVDIEPERFDRYEALFRLDDRRADALLARVGVTPGEVIVDFGCGPGYVATQLARLAGPKGHVHAVDVNAAFVERARAVAAEAGRADRVTVHHSLDERIPLPDSSVDRVYAKNVLEYVPNLHAVLAELHRILRPGGTMVASDSDFGFVVVEPLLPTEVTELFEAAAPAFRDPFVGRKLRSAYVEAGFTDVDVNITAAVDTAGHLRGVIENMFGYATRFQRMTTARAAQLRAKVDDALAAGLFQAVLPQWWVIGRKSH